jgi:biopolymer transport protein TolQ
MDIPVVEMISRAGWVARLILALLGLFSIMTWAIIFNRMIFLGKASKGNRQFMRKYAGMKTLGEIEKLDKKDVGSPVGILGKLGVVEYKRILEDSHAMTGVRDWSFILQNQFGMALERVNTTFSELVRKLDKGLIYLAISSSVAPFLGLLGTVWGIMNAFYQIGNQGSASLPVVAPGIAEALITTIIGLAVAIPAVLFYNYFVHRVELIENEMDEFRNLLQAHIKRDIFNVLYGKSKEQ